MREAPRSCACVGRPGSEGRRRSGAAHERGGTEGRRRAGHVTRCGRESDVAAGAVLGSPALREPVSLAVLQG